jgi:hypothetical protein
MSTSYVWTRWWLWRPRFLISVINAGHRPGDHIARLQFFPRANPQSRGIIVRPQSFPGTLLQDESSIVYDELLILRKSIENCRTFRKMKTQFCWTPGEKYYNFCYSCLNCFLIILCMKNRNVKNLDLWYLKIYRSYVCNFWICCVLCHE